MKADSNLAVEGSRRACAAGAGTACAAAGASTACAAAGAMPDGGSVMPAGSAAPPGVACTRKLVPPAARALPVKGLEGLVTLGVPGPEVSALRNSCCVQPHTAYVKDVFGFSIGFLHHLSITSTAKLMLPADNAMRGKVLGYVSVRASPVVPAAGTLCRLRKGHPG